MSSTEKEILQITEDSRYNAESCRYNVKGICILSDCCCQAVADGHTICSSFKNND